MKVLLALALLAGPVLADPPAIDAVRATQTAQGWRFDVTLSHPDTGWEHYADGWRVLDAEGREIGRRDLLHPHVDEQPFTRSLSGVPVPDGAGQVRIEARCSVDGWAGETVAVPLP